LSLYSHNVVTVQALEEAVAGSPALDAPIVVAEMAPALATRAGLTALREAGYAGVGVWGWGTRDKYEWHADGLARVVAPLRPHAEQNDLNLAPRE
jgi:hypothetical protein